MKSIYCYEIESKPDKFKILFLYEKELRVFTISKVLDQRKELFKFLKDQVKGLVGYNCLSYHAQILEFLLKYKTANAKWLNEVHEKLIDNEYEDKVQPWALKIPHLDLYKIHHFDNKNKRTSLNWCAFGMDINLHDNIQSIAKLYELSKPMINLRKKLSKKYGMNMMNMSNSKIGSELCLHLYSKRLNLSKKQIRYTKTHRDEIIIKDILFDYKFKNKEFNNLYNWFKNQKIVAEAGMLNLKNALEYSVVFNEFKYNYSTGGMHGSVKNTRIISDTDVILGIDVNSLYPSIAVNNNTYPAHLDKEFVNVFKEILDTKMNSKDDIKTAFKEATVSLYGNSNNPYSWLYDPQFTVQVAVNGQLLMSKLIDLLPVEMLHVDTDGLIFKTSKDNVDKCRKICDNWEKETGLSLKYTKYKQAIFYNGSNYILEDINGGITSKGWCKYKDIPLHQDKSFSIIPKAVNNFFINNTPIEDTIRNHKDIFDFCASKRIRNNRIKFELHSIDVDQLKKVGLPKTIRYYADKKGAHLFKIGAKKEYVEMFKVSDYTEIVKDYNINHDYYITEATKLINTIVNNQLKLF